MRIDKYTVTIIVAFSLILASCASHTEVYPDPVNIQSVIQAGDKVKIVTKDNQEAEFVVIEVNDEYIIGENIKVPLKDITGMKEETVSAGKNALFITILTVGLAGAALVGVASAPFAASAGAQAVSETLITTSAVAGQAAASSGSAASSRLVGPFNRYHPGDWYAFEHDRIDENLCANECKAKFNCEEVSTTENTMQQYYGRTRLTYTILCPPMEACKFRCKEKNILLVVSHHIFKVDITQMEAIIADMVSRTHILQKISIKKLNGRKIEMNVWSLHLKVSSSIGGIQLQKTYLQIKSLINKKNIIENV